MRASQLLMGVSLASIALSGCVGGSSVSTELPPAAFVNSEGDSPSEEYVIGPLDQLTIFVWRNPELGAKVQVRPDGRITTPLISDMSAVGKTPGQLSEDIRVQLSKYIRDPRVSVMIDNFSGTFSQQIRIIGATEKPASLPYRANMTLLDAMISVGGLSEFAAGDRARLIRADRASGTQIEYKLRLNKLLKQGDSSANVKLEPGDVIIIPSSAF